MRFSILLGALCLMGCGEPDHSHVFLTLRSPDRACQVTLYGHMLVGSGSSTEIARMLVDECGLATEEPTQ